MEEARKVAAMAADQSKEEKKRLFWENKNEKRTSLKNAASEPTFQKYKGRILLRGNTVKDDSGSYAELQNKVCLRLKGRLQK